VHPIGWFSSKTRRRTCGIVPGLFLAAIGAAIAQPPRTQVVLPQPEPPFRGKIGRTVKDSTPDYTNGRIRFVIRKAALRQRQPHSPLGSARRGSISARFAVWYTTVAITADACIRSAGIA